LKQHSGDVAAEAALLAKQLHLPAALTAELVTAARWHDAGKAHTIWQDAAKKLGSDPPVEPVAKSQAQRKTIRFERRGFRHELASALLALQHGQSDLACFLIACHHGKVRLSLRALPNETIPGEQGRTMRYARGVWEGDDLPEIDLGGDIVVPATRLTLRYMELGDDDRTGPSWLSRMLALRDDPGLGPFRLGFLEALIKCADERASEDARRKGGAQ
jgi:CRISPR-associated endonuclease/helicase Cas3